MKLNGSHTEISIFHKIEQMCMWQPCLLTDQDKISNRYRVPSIYGFYKVSVHLAKQFQRRRFLEIGQTETIISCSGHVCKWIGTK